MKVFFFSFLVLFLVFIILFFTGPQWFHPQYQHAGYLELPKEEALQFVAKHNDDGTIMAFNDTDNWAVTYNFYNSSPTFYGITGKLDGSWMVARWIVLGILIVGAVGSALLFLVSLIFEEADTDE